MSGSAIARRAASPSPPASLYGRLRADPRESAVSGAMARHVFCSEGETPKSL